MKQTINESDFRTAFARMDRADQFSYDGLTSLFDYLEEMEEETGEQIELDVIALCCEYTEYENLEAFWADYDKDEYPDFDAIRDVTTVIENSTESFIIQQF
ncbi:MAG: hypothetical protein JJE49_09560 [Peptostreptococcaceae bacterium]|nr:hypothetical protein [Peptostreptococcaceae bacterium]